MRDRAALAATLALALTLAACGDGGGATTAGSHPGVPEPAAAPTLTTRAPVAGKAGFVAAADRACARYRREIGPVNRGLARQLRGTRRRPAKLAALLERGAVAAEHTVSRIGALTPPPGDEQTIAAYLETGREAARGLRGAADAVRADDGPGADRRMAEVRLASSRGRTIATSYGFLVCGSPNPQAG